MKSMTDPIQRFRELFDRAAQTDIPEPTAMTLATATPNGIPSARIVLLKAVDERGFVFFTNYGSRKGGELQDNPHAALVFHWQTLEAQVRVEGTVEQVNEREADEYFNSRPRGSRIGAWASQQSRPLASKAELQERINEFESRFQGREVPRPPHWSGFRVVPVRIEFWKGQPSRLHDRDLYVRDGSTGGWMIGHLYP